MLYIGIAGFMHSGKDTVASMLIANLTEMGIKVSRRAWGDSLKEELAAMLHNYFLSDISYDEYLRRLHSSPEKERYRLLLKWWGTEGQRGHRGENYWIDKVDEYARNEGAAYDVLVIPDCRFLNELSRVKGNDGLCVLVNRSECAVGDTHSSESEFLGWPQDEWDCVIHNDGSLEELSMEVQRLAQVVELRVGANFETK